MTNELQLDGIKNAEDFIDYVSNRCNGLGIMCPTNYSLVPMGNLAQFINPKNPFALTDSELAKLSDMLSAIAKRKPIHIDKSFVLNYVSQNRELRKLIDKVPKVLVPIDYNLSKEAHCFTDVKYLASVTEDIEKLPSNPSKELTDLVSNMYTYSQNKFWFLGASTIPELLLYDLFSRAEMIIPVSDLLARLFYDHQKDLKMKSYIIDNNMTPLSVCYFENDWRMLKMNHNMQVIIERVEDDRVVEYVEKNQ